MTREHLHLEFLCTLAPSGQLTQQELAELRDHVALCASCGNRLREIEQLGTQLSLAQGFRTSRSRTPKGMQERFVTRAISEGIPLRRVSLRPRLSNALPHMLGLAVAGTLAMLLIAVNLRTNSIFGHSLSTESTGKVLVARALTRPAQVAASPVAIKQSTSRGERKRSPSVPASITSKRTSSDDVLALAQRQFSFSRGLPIFTQPEFSVSTALRMPQVESLFANGPMRSKPGFASLQVADGRDLAQLWAENEAAASPHLNFTFIARMPVLTARELHKSLDLDAYLPDSKPVSEASVPRFRLIQNATD